jgi:hypothetical protein
MSVMTSEKNALTFENRLLVLKVFQVFGEFFLVLKVFKVFGGICTFIFKYTHLSEHVSSIFYIYHYNHYYN